MITCGFVFSSNLMFFVLTTNLSQLDCHVNSLQTTDYLKIGTPLQFVLWMTSTWVLSTSLPWYVSLGITIIILVVVYVLRFWRAALINRFKDGAVQSSLVDKPTDKDSDTNFNEFVSSIYNNYPVRAE